MNVEESSKGRGISFIGNKQRRIINSPEPKNYLLEEKKKSIAGTVSEGGETHWGLPRGKSKGIGSTMKVPGGKELILVRKLHWRETKPNLSQGLLRREGKKFKIHREEVRNRKSIVQVKGKRKGVLKDAKNL